MPPKDHLSDVECDCLDHDEVESSPLLSPKEKDSPSRGYCASKVPLLCCLCGNRLRVRWWICCGLWTYISIGVALIFLIPLLVYPSAMMTFYDPPRPFRSEIFGHKIIKLRTPVPGRRETPTTLMLKGDSSKCPIIAFGGNAYTAEGSIKSAFDYWKAAWELTAPGPTSSAEALRAFKNPRIFSMDYRGYSWMNKGRTTEANLVEDAVALIRHAYKVTGKKVMLWNFSLGCAVSIAAAERVPDMVECMMLVNPFTSMWRTVMNFVPVAPYMWFWSVLIGTDHWDSLGRISNKCFQTIPVMVLSSQHMR